MIQVADPTGIGSRSEHVQALHNAEQRTHIAYRNSHIWKSKSRVHNAVMINYILILHGFDSSRMAVLIPQQGAR
jgi:hypothetical protein